jgi:inorganic phosphate transporter, PiT family
MLSTTAVITIIVVVLAVGFDFINGFHDTATAIATSVTTRVLTPTAAIIMSAGLNLLGAFLSVKVAQTVGASIVDPTKIPQTVVMAALIGAIIWNLVTWYYGIPSSSSHAIIGGLLGAAIMFHGSLNIVHWGNFFWKVLLWLLLSPIIGFIVGFIFMTALNWLLRKMRPASITKVFSKAQIVSAAAVALNHGSNDAQKSMGIITMALVSGGYLKEFNVPLWVKIACAIAMALGTSVGGWKIIKTMGMSMSKLAPVNGFAAQTAAALVIFTGTMLHAPVSTTHITSTSIMGVGASKRLSSVRWIVAKNIVWSWVLTIPVCAAVAALTFSIIRLF